MKKIVRNVCKESSFRVQRFHRFQRFLNCGMSGMGIVAECVKEQNIQITQPFAALGGNLAVIGEIGAIAEPKTVNGSFPMGRLNRLYSYVVDKNRFVLEGVQRQARAA